MIGDYNNKLKIYYDYIKNLYTNRIIILDDMLY